MYGLSKKQKLKHILEQVKELEISAYEIGKKTGLSITGIDKILSGTVKNPHENTLNIIVEFLESKVLGTNLKDSFTQNSVNEPKGSYKKENYKLDLLSEIAEIEEVIKERQKIILLDPKQKKHQEEIIKLLKTQIELIKNNTKIIDK